MSFAKKVASFVRTHARRHETTYNLMVFETGYHAELAGAVALTSGVYLSLRSTVSLPVRWLKFKGWITQKERSVVKLCKNGIAKLKPQQPTPQTSEPSQVDDPPLEKT